MKIFAAIVRLGVVLMFNIFHNRFIRHVAARCNEISPSPKMATPILFLNMPKLLQDLSGCSTLYPLHNFTWRQVRRTRQQKVNVIARHRSLQDLNFQSLTRFANQIANTKSDRADQNRPAILCHPYKVKLDIKTTMCTGSVVFHSRQYNK